MFSLNKRFIAGLLIIAMIFANAGMSTLAVSISHYVDEANKNAKDDSDITYRYYEEYRYSYESKTTLLMNSEAESGGRSDANDAAEQGSAGAGAENTGAPEETTGISETDSSDFGVDENKSENNEDEEGSQSSPEQEEDGEEFGPWMDDANAGNDGEYEEELEDDAVTDGESEQGEQGEAADENEEEFGPWRDESNDSDGSEEGSQSSPVQDEEGSQSSPVQEESSETSVAPEETADSSETAEDENDADIASASDAEIETKEYDEEFGPWREEEVASISEAEEVKDENVATDSEIKNDDLDIATESVLTPLPVASESKMKLFGAGEHVNHKVCGITGTCEHTQVSSHDTVPTWTSVTAGISTEDFRTLLNGSGTKYLYLNSNIGTKGSSASISLGGTTYICLNGFDMYDVSFTGSYEITFVNCSEFNSTIYQSPDATSALIRTSNENKYFFGVDNNLTIDAKSFVNHTTGNNVDVCFYGVNIIKSEDQSFTSSFIRGSNARSPIVYMEKASVSNLKVGLFVNKPAIKLKDSSFDNCAFEDTFINTERNYTAYESVSRESTNFSGTVNIKNSTIGTFVYNGAQELIISGNVEISNSK